MIKVTRRLIPAMMAMAMVGVSVQAVGGVVVDPTGDFIPSYTGVHAGDLDVTSINVTFDGSQFILSATMNAAIGFTPGAFYVWGVNRGAGTSRFPDQAPGVLFDSVISLQQNGTGTVNRLTPAGAGSSVLDPSAITISGNTITAIVPVSLLPSQGFAASAYTFNLWPRLTGATSPISDFAPDNSNIGATSVPEPSTFLMLGIAGVMGLACVKRRR